MGSGALVFVGSSRLADCRTSEYDTVIDIESSDYSYEDVVGGFSCSEAGEDFCEDSRRADSLEVFIDRPDCIAGDIYESIEWIEPIVFDPTDYE